MDDSRLVTLTLASARGAAAALTITCRSKRLDVRVTWPTPLTDARLRVRLDDGRDRDDRSQWTLLPDSLGVSYRGDRPEGWVRLALNLFLRLRGAAITATRRDPPDPVLLGTTPPDAHGRERA